MSQYKYSRPQQLIHQFQLSDSDPPLPVITVLIRRFRTKGTRTGVTVIPVFRPNSFFIKLQSCKSEGLWYHRHGIKVDWRGKWRRCMRWWWWWRNQRKDIMIDKHVLHFWLFVNLTILHTCNLRLQSLVKMTAILWINLRNNGYEPAII